MKSAKRQEVCDIFQGMVNEMYQMAVKNKARLSPEDQKLLSNRDLFIEKLGFQNNRVIPRWALTAACSRLSSLSKKIKGA